MPFAWQNGAELQSSDKFSFDSAEMTQTLDYYKSFFTDNLSAGKLAPGALESGFIKGSIGSFVSGPWHMGILRDQGGAKFEGKWGVAAMPTAKSGTSFVGGGDLMVFKNSKNRDTAWKFVDYLTQVEAEQKLYQAGRQPAGSQECLGHRRPRDRPDAQDVRRPARRCQVGTGDRRRGSRLQTRWTTASRKQSWAGRPAMPHSRLRRARPTPSAPARADMSSVVLGDKTAPSRRRTGSPVRRREVLAAYCFAAPFFVLFLVFTVGPVISSFAMSFTDLTSRDVRHPLSVNPVGLDNYTKLLHDDTFHQAVLNTVYFVVVGVPLGMVLSLAAAVALNTGITRFRTFFRVAYYLPVVTSIVAIAVVWRFLLEPDSGIVNTLLGYVGIDGPSWLQDQRARRCRR